MFLTLNLTSCADQKPNFSNDDLPQILLRGYLNVIVFESTMPYFEEMEQNQGFEYAQILDFVSTIGVPAKFLVAHNADEMRQMLLAGQGDLIACRVPMSRTNKALFAFADNRHASFPVLIQPDSCKITEPTALIGEDVFVPEGSWQLNLLKNLNNELGGGINIFPVPKDEDQLFAQVSSGEIPLTVADYEMAQYNENFYPNINFSVVLGLTHEYAWALRKTSPMLLQALNKWHNANLKYWNRLKIKHLDFSSKEEENLKNVKISPFDSLFQKYAPEIGWDWRLLASVAYHETRFNPQVVSYAGALGLMQLMPQTAERFGLDSISVFSPEENIAASIKYIRHLNAIFKRIENSAERQKFILASYNSGPAHVLDAMALAKKYGENPYLWGCVEKFLLLKSEPQYYNDPLCKSGYFRANHTVRYVKDVLNYFNKYSKISE